MATQGKILTLFEDKEKTQGVFPRTKISAVSNENGVGLDAILDSVVSIGEDLESTQSLPIDADTLNGYTVEELMAGNGDEIYIGDEESNATAPLNADTFDGHTVTTLLSVVYPVGSIYMSLNQLSPATLFGFGTWELIKDRFILGAGGIYGLGSTGGEASHKLTREELPRDTMMFANREANQWTTGEWQESANANWKAEPNSTTGYFETNGDQPHNNMPPYLAVHIWKRTA